MENSDPKTPHQPDSPLPVCDYENSDYQQRFWEEGGREYEDSVEAVALQRLLPPEGNLLLEVGAGAGRNTLRYQNFKQIVLMDYSFTQMEQAQARLGSHERYLYVAANIYHTPFIPGIFDAATMIRVIHHLAEAPLALQQIYQSLQPGAIFILEFANKHNIKSIARYLLGIQKWSPFTREPIEFVPLNFDFHPSTISQWLQECGFSIQRYLTVSHFRAGFLKQHVPLSLLVGLDSILQNSGNWLKLSPSIFVRSQVKAQKAPAIAITPPLSPEAIFRCPACGKYPLETNSEGLLCPDCKHLWKNHGGIFDFRLE
jgi:ubiquinone/menaquinone biosynthesis C-methylase UbiE